jgi:hypothetical protein
MPKSRGYALRTIIRATSQTSKAEAKDTSVPARTVISFEDLFRPVRLYVVLGGMLGVLHSMNVVRVRQMRVMGCFFVIPPFVMIRGFMVMASSMLMMLRCFSVMMSCFL